MTAGPAGPPARRAKLETGHVLELTDTEGARAEYQRFLELCKNANGGLPELEEARQFVDDASREHRRD